MANPRLLGPSDTAALERYCERHRARSMFLASNLSRAPLGSRGHRLAGVYVGAFVGSELVGVVAHYEGNNLVTCAHEHARPLARLAVRESGRRLSALVGPDPECGEVADDLLSPEQVRSLDAKEHLFELELAALATVVSDPGLRVRGMEARDLDQLCKWSADYAVEAIGRTPEQARGVKAMAKQRESRERSLADGTSYVLQDAATGQLLAMTDFTARVPGCVQVGGVWTPPELRGRGYATQVVHGQLMHARAQGDTHAVLFTEHDNVPAQRVYTRLGFRATGEWRLILLGEPVLVQLG